MLLSGTRNARRTRRRLAGVAALGALAWLPARAQTPASAQPQQAPAASQAPGQAASQAPGQAPEITLPQVNIIAASPLLGSGVDRNTVPGATTVLTGPALTRGNTTTPNAIRALNEEAPGVNIDSASGNPYQPTFFYHGYQASALQGTPQGLAIYVNGIRFNQAFGDTVNFDLLPQVAINTIDLVGSNPVYGLNALGGALNIQLKNGFTYQGAEVEMRGGSFGTFGGYFQYGKQSGNTAVYVAGSGVRQGGWRADQNSALENFYGDIGWRSDIAELHFNTLLAHSALSGPGTSPVDLIWADPAAQFTAPNFVGNQLMQLSLNGNVQINDYDSVQAVAYYDNFHQRVSNGNAPNDTPCADNPSLLCNDTGPSTTYGGAPIAANFGPSPFAYSELDNQTTNTNGYGASIQVTDTRDVFGLKNNFVAGFSFDGAQTMFTGVGLIGGLTPLSRTFIGPGIVIDEPGTNVPVRVAVSDAYYGVFFADTLNLTDRLALTVSGRYNTAQVDLSDQDGTGLTGNHYYSHFNPAGGLTYQFAPWLTAYAGYAEANRAPTPAELSCAGPQNSCSLANFFAGDPDLQQVVAHTVEFGFRGNVTTAPNSRLSYDLGFYRSDLSNDIAFVNSVTLNRAYFTNVGDTRRQGVDANLTYKTPRWSAYVAYSYTDATFQNGFVQAAGSNPAGDANGNITVHPGNRLPGIPAHTGKLGMTYTITPPWIVSAAMIVQSGQYLFGDDPNLTPPLPPFFTLTMSTSYQLTPHVQLFAEVDNVTNQRFYTYGTFSPTSSIFLAQAPNATNPRAYSPGPPVAGFGGIRITF
jgi:outer membrane receptor protein involved in Fe transport